MWAGQVDRKGYIGYRWGYGVIIVPWGDMYEPSTNGRCMEE